MLNERETELLKVTLDKRGHYYYINAWGRSSRRGMWQPVWINRVHLSYLRALNEFNDTGALLLDFKNQLSISNMAA